MTEMTREALEEYSDNKRLEVFKILTSACTHLYSKGKLQRDRFDSVVPVFADLCRHDPIFMAHLTAYAAKGDSKDLKVLTTFFNSLNDADGTPFFKGSARCKPNFRQVSAAVLQNMSPHEALRVLQFSKLRFGVEGSLNNAYHFPASMRQAFNKYMWYRESNPEFLKGIKRSGMTRKMQNMYRMLRLSPSDEAVNVLQWPQKDGRMPTDDESKLPDFASMKSKEIAEWLQDNKVSPVVTLTVIPPEKVTVSVARALLEHCSGNQFIIFQNWIRKNGLMDTKGIADLFAERVKDATSAIDRIDTLSKNADEDEKKAMAQVRSTHRKRTMQIDKIGKIFLHIDVSTSMHEAIDWAKERACLIAECVDNPEENFRWGTFARNGKMLPLPSGFTKEDFHEALYGVQANGSTDCLALYEQSREFGANVDVYVTDQGHNGGSVPMRIRAYHEQHPEAIKPTSVIVAFGRRGIHNSFDDLLKSAGMAVGIIDHTVLTESAGVTEAIRDAMLGELKVIEDILETPLPRLPRWWDEIAAPRVAVTA